MPFTCSICGEAASQICARCTKDVCANHICEKCLRCSDCCECEIVLDAAPPKQVPMVRDMATPIDSETPPEQPRSQSGTPDETDPRATVP